MSQPELKGFLKKWTNYVYRWKRRYFFIKDGVLSYCDGPDEEPKGSIHLLVSSIKLYADDPLRITLNSGANLVHLRCGSISEKIKWLNAIRIAQLNESTSHYKPLDIKPAAGGEDQVFFEDSLVGQIIQSQSEFEFQLNELITRHNGNEELKSDLVKLMERFNDISIRVTEALNHSEQEKDKYKRLIEQLNQDITEMSNIEVDKMSRSQRSAQENDLDPEMLEGIGLLDAKSIDLPKRHSSHSNSNSRREEEEKKVESQRKDSINKLELKSHAHLKAELIAQSSFLSLISSTLPPTRCSLPESKFPIEKLNILSVMKDSIGKDTSKLSFPVKMNEPLSTLQRQAELFEYSSLLSEANVEIDQYRRLALVSAFAVSVYSSSIGRLHKPFNPMLGETYEWSENGIKFISEQVSHHPPICATFAQSNEFTFWSSTSLKTNFWGKSIEFKLGGACKLRLASTNEIFSYNRVTSSLENLLLGKMYVENAGDLVITNETTGDQCALKLMKRGWGNRGAYEINGELKGEQGKVVMKLKGGWDSHLSVIDVRSGVEYKLWTRHEQTLDPRYSFTPFALNLNHLTTELLHSIPITDSRLRPDQRAIEFGDIELASSLKGRLEEKQRMRREEDESDGLEYKPKWFIEVEKGDEPCFEFTNEYWRVRENGFDSLALVNIFEIS